MFEIESRNFQMMTQRATSLTDEGSLSFAQRMDYKDVWGSGEIAPQFLTSTLDGAEWSASRLGRFAFGEKPPVLIAKEAGWAPEPVWTTWRTENSLPYR
jgi:hypothetical protein